MEAKKEQFIKTLMDCYGNITRACEIQNIHRQTYYLWKREDSEFSKAVDEIDFTDHHIDFVENALHKKIEAGDTTAIIFYLKTKAKKRGYTEKSEMDITTNGKELNPIQIYLPEKKSE